MYFDEYLYGLSPGYWFIPNTRDLIRHRMEDYGLLLRATLPFAALGLFQVLRNFRSPAHRAILISFLAAPAGAAMVQVAVTRALAMVIPATLLTALGLVMILVWLGNVIWEMRTGAAGAPAEFAIGWRPRFPRSPYRPSIR